MWSLRTIASDVSAISIVNVARKLNEVIYATKVACYIVLRSNLPGSGNFFRLLAAVLVKRLLRRVLVYCQIEYLESYLYLAGVAITSNSSFPGPLGGVCGWTRSKWSLILRELCLLLFLVKLYWTESTPLLTNYFSSAVSIVEDRYLYFAVWRRKDRITSKFPGNLVTNVTTRNKRDNFISDQ